MRVDEIFSLCQHAAAATGNLMWVYHKRLRPCCDLVSDAALQQSPTMQYSTAREFWPFDLHLQAQDAPTIAIKGEGMYTLVRRGALPAAQNYVASTGLCLY